MIDAYVRAAVTAKGPSLDAVTARETLGKVLGHPYKAVALDIDGTVTGNGDVALDGASSRMLADLARRGIPLALITGRGRSGATAFSEELAKALDAEDVADRERVWIYCHHAGFRARLDELIHRGPPAWTELADGHDIDADVFAELMSKGHPDMTHEPFSVRLVSDEAPSAEFEELASLHGLRRIQGAYRGVPVFEYLSLTKAEAIVDFARVTGLAEPQIVSIGDMGHEGGADFELLDRAAGFTTDRASDSAFGCFPVRGGERPKIGAAAAVQVLEDLVFLPPLSRQVAEDDLDTLGAFHAFQRKARGLGAERWNRAENWLRRLEGHLYGGAGPTQAIPDIYDRRSGGVWIRDEEACLIGADYGALGDFFHVREMARPPEATHRSARARAWYTDSGILLRGNEHYPLTQHNQPAAPLLAAVSVGILEMAEVLSPLPQPRNRTELKLLLAGMDYVRHKALVTLTLALERRPAGAGPTQYIEFAAAAWEELCAVSRLYDELLTESQLPDWQVWVGQFAMAAHRVADLLASREEHLDLHGLTVKQAFRWREADWPLESLLAMDLAVSALDDELTACKAMNVVGLAFGGVELPAFVESRLRKRDIDVHSFAAMVSVYGKMASGDRLRRRDETYYDSIQELLPYISLSGDVDFAALPTLIVDDNSTTGLSLEIARDLVSMIGGKPIGAGLVRFPGPGRWHQMCLQDHGSLDPFWYFNWVFGLVSPSPYTRTNRQHPSHSKYEDELGNFDKAKARIERLHTKNQPLPRPSIGSTLLAPLRLVRSAIGR